MANKRKSSKTKVKKTIVIQTLGIKPGSIKLIKQIKIRELKKKKFLKRNRPNPDTMFLTEWPLGIMSNPHNCGICGCTGHPCMTEELTGRKGYKKGSSICK